MMQVNVLEAKNNLSALLKKIESGEENEVVIARRGIPVAKLVPTSVRQVVSCRIGAARGERLIVEGYDFFELDGEIAEAMMEVPLEPAD